ncbi:MAG: AAA family ATPase [Pirellulaceae bacterium]|nr:AAA family ATPase [Pirellulaceae bacterium]
MDHLWNFFEQQLAHNQLFSGGLILMIGGALLAYFRALPGQAWEWLKGLWVIEIDILDREAAFHWVDCWLAQHTYARDKARWLTVKTQEVLYEERQAEPAADHRPRILFTPAPGRHFLFYRGRLVILHRERPKMNQAAQQPVNVRESFSLTIFSRDRSIARLLLEDARDAALPLGSMRLTVYRANYSSWSEQLTRLPRSPESVILRAGLMGDLIADARSFLRRRTWYLDRGIPYRRGFLLHGPPGTGKSSAVVAIASSLEMDIALLSLSGSSLDDNELGELLSQVPTNAILLIEDIDCAFTERIGTTEKQNKLTFSGLLNAIDGVAAGEGRILFATTNHLEKLDPALIRPGRIDRKVEIALATCDQARRMFRRFFAGGDESLAALFADAIPELTLPMSAIQTHLIRYAESAEDACENVDELLPQSTPQLVLPAISSNQDAKEFAAIDMATILNA